jgi:hypothetical protein
VPQLFRAVVSIRRTGRIHPPPTGEEVPDPVLRRGKVWLESKIPALRETGQVQETSDLPGWGNQEQPIGIQCFERVEQDMRPGGVHKRDRTHIEANVAGRRQQMVNLGLQQASGSQVDLPEEPESAILPSMDLQLC